MDEPQVPIATFYAYDQDDIDKLAHASNYSLILWDIETKLRNDYKWGDFPTMTVTSTSKSSATRSRSGNLNIICRSEEAKE